MYFLLFCIYTGALALISRIYDRGPKNPNIISISFEIKYYLRNLFYSRYCPLQQYPKIKYRWFFILLWLYKILG